jgi:hypothetical protein
MLMAIAWSFQLLAGISIELPECPHDIEPGISRISDMSDKREREKERDTKRTNSYNLISE